MKHAIHAVPFLIMAIFAGCGLKGTGKSSDFDALKALEIAAPADWMVRETGRGLPTEWVGEDTCREFQLYNPKRTYTSSRGGVEYNPFYQVWICEPGFGGLQSYIYFTEARFPACYMGDSADGVLFVFSAGQTDWPDGDIQISIALGMSRPDESRPEDAAVEAFYKVFDIPEGAEFKFEATTDTSILALYSASGAQSEEEVEATVNAAARAVKRHVPGYRRMLILIRYGGGFYARVIPL